MTANEIVLLGNYDSLPKYDLSSTSNGECTDCEKIQLKAPAPWRRRGSMKALTLEKPVELSKIKLAATKLEKNDTSPVIQLFPNKTAVIPREETIRGNFSQASVRAKSGPITGQPVGRGGEIFNEGLTRRTAPVIKEGK